MNSEHQRRRAQAHAEQLHKDTGAMFTICIAADFPAGDLVVGAWCPNQDVVVAILRKVADRIEAKNGVEIIDHTKGER